MTHFDTQLQSVEKLSKNSTYNIVNNVLLHRWKWQSPTHIHIHTHTHTHTHLQTNFRSMYILLYFNIQMHHFQYQ